MRPARLVAAFVLACSFSAVHAQATNPFNGEWEITVYDADGVATKGGGNINMVVNGDKGTYQNRSHDLRRGSDSDCNKLLADLEKVSFTDTQLDVTVNRGAKLRGCNDMRIVFKRDGDRLVGRVITTRDGVDTASKSTLVAKKR